MIALRQVISYAFNLLFIISVFAKLLDAYRNLDFVKTHFITSSNMLLVFTLVFAVALRLKGIFPFSPIVTRFITFFLTPFTLLCTIIFIAIDQMTYVNFIYSKLFIQIESVFLLGLFFLTISIIFLPSAWLKKHYKSFLFFLPFGLLALFYIYKHVPFDAWMRISHEDSLIEYLQVVALLTASFFAIKNAKVFFTNRKVLLSIVFIFAAIVLFGVAGDEISWGQRIFHLQAPQFILENNTQGEITIHNQYRFSGYVPMVYGLIGLYGSTAWIPFWFLKHIFKRNIFPQFFVPQAFLFLYFFFAYAYNYALRWGDYSIITGGGWAEMTELLLYSGAMLHFIYIYITLKAKI